MKLMHFTKYHKTFARLVERWKQNEGIWPGISQFLQMNCTKWKEIWEDQWGGGVDTHTAGTEFKHCILWGNWKKHHVYCHFRCQNLDWNSESQSFVLSILSEIYPESGILGRHSRMNTHKWQNICLNFRRMIKSWNKQAVSARSCSYKRQCMWQWSEGELKVTGTRLSTRVVTFKKGSSTEAKKASCDHHK